MNKTKFTSMGLLLIILLSSILITGCSQNIPIQQSTISPTKQCDINNPKYDKPLKISLNGDYGSIENNSFINDMRVAEGYYFTLIIPQTNNDLICVMEGSDDIKIHKILLYDAEDTWSPRFYLYTYSNSELFTFIIPASNKTNWKGVIRPKQTESLAGTSMKISCYIESCFQDSSHTFQISRHSADGTLVNETLTIGSDKILYGVEDSLYNIKYSSMSSIVVNFE